MMNFIDDFDLLTIEDVNAFMRIEQIDYDDYVEAFTDEDTYRPLQRLYHS